MILQCGLFVTADMFSASLHPGLFTHYKREENRNMRSGKFDEELVRMNAIADQIHRSALVLFNESFAATHEQEGSEIARQIVSALLENNITVFFVSHMYEFARSFLDGEPVLFLRADRGENGVRSFRLVPAKPLPKSFGVDLYERIFANSQKRGARHFAWLAARSCWPTTALFLLGELESGPTKDGQMKRARFTEEQIIAVLK